jgi:hypothetical protein
MGTNPKWVLSCKGCHAECVFAEIPDDTASYFFPKKPQVPENFAHKCKNCGHRGTYERTDLRYRDDTMPSHAKSSKCGEGEGAKDRTFGAAN